MKPGDGKRSLKMGRQHFPEGHVECPFCGRIWHLNEKAVIGLRADCPGCGKVIEVVSIYTSVHWKWCEARAGEQAALFSDVAPSTEVTP